MARPKPLVLVILDGWGYAPPSPGNAIALARKPNYDQLLRDFPNTLIYTSGRYVGLPDGQMGNSEVGHMNMGAGRIVYMDITKIDVFIESGDFFKNPVLTDAMAHARKGERRLHLFGLLSDGGVHSHQRHLYALLKMARRQGLERVFVHCFMDGRDTLPTNGAGYIEQLQQQMATLGVGQIASVNGRYYAMDRDRRWPRIAKAVDAMVHGRADSNYVDAVQGMKDSYNRGVTDEFVVPFVCVDERREPIATIRNEDTCINFNFRADRARQITRALARNSGLAANHGSELPDAEQLNLDIPIAAVPKNLRYVCMTRYDKEFTLPVVVPPDSMANLLADVMGNARLRNLRVAETEKYAHVTYFFNGGVEKPFPGEERVLVPSKKDFATYDLVPEMSAAGIANEVVKAVEQKTFDIIIVNFANADMVGHSGKIPPTVTAVETVDACLGRIQQAVRQNGGAMIVTADHGNAEQMIDPASGGPHTAHTTNPVPLVIASEDGARFQLRGDGSLQDLAPTMLSLLGIPQPAEMKGSDLRVTK